MRVPLYRAAWPSSRFGLTTIPLHGKVMLFRHSRFVFPLGEHQCFMGRTSLYSFAGAGIGFLAACLIVRLMAGDFTRERYGLDHVVRGHFPRRFRSHCRCHHRCGGGVRKKQGTGERIAAAARVSVRGIVGEAAGR